MASASRINFTPTVKPVYAADNISEESATAASEVLQDNHDEHHIFFSKSGFHNHISHHISSIYALGAPADLIRKQYELMKPTQRPQPPLKEDVVQEIADPKKRKNYLGVDDEFHNFLAFYEREIDAKGYQAVINEYVLSGTEDAEDLLVRLYAGLLHPIIHLGIGIEFEQPALIAEALAEASVSGNWPGPLLLGAEKLAGKPGTARKESRRSLVSLLEESQGNDKVRSAPHWDDGNKIRDGLMARALQDLLPLAAAYTVGEGELEMKLAEMINFCAYFSGAAQRPPYIHKCDFFLIHCTNASVYYPAILRAEWISTANKQRLLEWKGRSDLVMYLSRGSPTLRLEEVVNYQPKRPDDGWKGIFERVNRYEDDGHTSKLIRSIANGERMCKPYEGKDVDWKIKGDLWLRLGHLAIDSVEAQNEVGGPRWVRSCGWQEAWKEVPLRKGAANGVNGHT